MRNPRAGHWSYQWYEVLALYVLYYGYHIGTAVVFLGVLYFLYMACYYKEDKG